MAPQTAPSFANDPDDDPGEVPAGASEPHLPQELAGLFPTLEALAESEVPRSAPTRTSIRAALEQPLDEMQTALDLVKAASAGGDPEFAVQRLLEFCAITCQQLLQVDDALARALRAPSA